VLLLHLLSSSLPAALPLPVSWLTGHLVLMYPAACCYALCVIVLTEAMQELEQDVQLINDRSSVNSKF
jgi:hypothetical protein